METIKNSSFTLKIERGNYSTHLTVKPVGYWADVLSLRLETRFDKDKIEFSHSSGGADSTISELERMDNYLKSVNILNTYAQDEDFIKTEFARMAKINEDREAERAKAHEISKAKYAKNLAISEANSTVIEDVKELKRIIKYAYSLAKIDEHGDSLINYSLINAKGILKDGIITIISDGGKVSWRDNLSYKYGKTQTSLVEHLANKRNVKGLI